MPVSISAEYMLANRSSGAGSDKASIEIPVQTSVNCMRSLPRLSMSLTLSKMVEVRAFDHSHVNVWGATSCQASTAFGCSAPSRKLLPFAYVIAIQDQYLDRNGA
jgi:hypothetical protein